MRKVLLVAALAVFSLTAQAQATFGVKAGANLANLGGDIDNTKMLFGFHVGGFAEIELAQDFFFAPELLYSAQGAKVEMSFFGQTFEADYKLNYLNVPLMVQYYVADNLYLTAGPQIGYLLSAKVSSEGESEDIDEGLKDIDFGLNIGLGYKMDSGLSFQARYNLGLANINDEDSDNFKINNSVIQISVGYSFN